LVLATVFYGIAYFAATQNKVMPHADTAATQSILILMYSFLLARAIIAFVSPMRHNMIFYYARGAKAHYIVRNLLWAGALGALTFAFSEFNNVIIYYLIAIKALSVLVPIRKEAVLGNIIDFWYDHHNPDHFKFYDEREEDDSVWVEKHRCYISRHRLPLVRKMAYEECKQVYAIR
jgi:hypothetical protein